MGSHLLRRAVPRSTGVCGLPLRFQQGHRGRPNVVDMMKNGDIVLVVNTVEERRNAIADSRAIRITALASRVATFTTMLAPRPPLKA